MEFYNLEQTCSMQEISIHSTSTIKSKEVFFNRLRDKCRYHGDIDSKYDEDEDSLLDVRCLIYNCQERNFEPYLKDIGFKKKNSYIGNNVGPDGNKVRINVWMLNVTKKLRKEINKYR